MDLDAVSNKKLLLKLFTNVRNVKDIRSRIMKGDLQCCIIKPSLIIDPFQVIIAANKAILSEKLTTKSIYTEMLFNLSPTKNISKSLQTFGIGDQDEQFLIAVLLKENENILDLFGIIDGDEVPLEKLNNYSDINLIKQTYKISEKECGVSSLLDSICSRIATKDFLSF